VSTEHVTMGSEPLRRKLSCDARTLPLKWGGAGEAEAGEGEAEDSLEAAPKRLSSSPCQAFPTQHDCPSPLRRPPLATTAALPGLH
jgi:hypothetical protein